MKIANNVNQNYNIYVTPRKTPAFKGYFACPIKELHLQSSISTNYGAMVDELVKKCGEYFDIIVQLRDGLFRAQDCAKFLTDKERLFSAPWGQDNKMFLEGNKLAILKKSLDPTYSYSFARFFGGHSQNISTPLEGGNCFVGKRPNGDTFAIVGEDTLENCTRRDTANSLNISANNLHVIPQSTFHIDLAIRPLVYPYILVGDPNLTVDLAQKTVKKKPQQMFLERLRTGIELEEENESSKTQKHPYKPISSLVNALKGQGFVPIRVPGLVGGIRAQNFNYGLNFMNAVVHQLPNGELVYITNHTNYGQNVGIDFEKIFQSFLKNKVPAIKKVIFIDGKGYTQQSISGPGGGIHCMACERPDFEKWGKLLEKPMPKPVSDSDSLSLRFRQWQKQKALLEG